MKFLVDTLFSVVILSLLGWLFMVMVLGLVGFVYGITPVNYGWWFPK